MLTSIFSVTNIISVVFMAYMGNNVYQLSKFWFPGRIFKCRKSKSKLWEQNLKIYNQNRVRQTPKRVTVFTL